MGCQDIKSLNYVICFINDITVTIIVDTNLISLHIKKCCVVLVYNI